MKKKATIILSLTLAAFMSANIFAANFKDVPANEWYTQYVNKAASAGIIKGYDDNTFKPKGSIAFTEISSLLGNLVNVTESEMQTANSTYGKELDAQLELVKKQGNKGIDWARPVILKCLQAGVYDMNQLKLAVESKMLLDTKPEERQEVNRVSTAVFFADALKVNVTAAALPYKDHESIPVNARTRIQALLDIGVLSKDGDGTGNFNSKGFIDRASIAKMLCVAMDYIAKNPTPSTNTSTPTPTPTPSVSNKNIKGTVKSVSKNGNQFVVLVTSGSKSEVVYVQYDTQLTVDNELALPDKIAEGMTADITYKSPNNIATKATFKSEETVIEGRIKSTYSNYRYEIEYTKGSIVNNTIELDFKGADITLDGSKANVADLNNNYEVKVTMLGDNVKKVEAKRGNAYADGTFYQFGYSNSERRYYIDIYPNNRSSRESVRIAGDSVYINGTNRRCSELTGYNRNNYILDGTPIRLKTNQYNEVTDIDTVFGNITNGVIQGYIYRRPGYNDSYVEVSPRIKRNTNSNDVEKFYVDSRTSVYINGSSYNSSLSSLNEDDFVKLTLRNGYIEKIEVNNSRGWGNTNADFGSGTVYAVGSSNNQLSISCDSGLNSDISSKRITFNLDNNTRYDDGNGSDKASDFWWAVRGSSYKNVEFKWYRNGSTYYITDIRIK